MLKKSAALTGRLFATWRSHPKENFVHNCRFISLSVGAALIFLPVQAQAQDLLASDDGPIVVLEADPVGENAELDALCAAQLNPSENSGFQAIAVNVSDRSSVSVTRGDAVVSGTGISSTSITNYQGAMVNGQSVNIHASADRVVTYPGSQSSVTVTTTTTKFVTGTCHVHKRTKGNDNDLSHPGFMIAPFGLNKNDVEIAGTPASTTSQEVTTSNVPWIDTAASQYGVQMVICISPNKNPGIWRGANGYTNQLGQACNTAWYKLLGSTPSVSVPLQ